MNNIGDEIVKVNQYLHDNKRLFNKEIGMTIKELRIENNISLEEFSEKSLMGPNQIVQIENGKNGVTLNKFLIICNALSIAPDELLEKFLYSSKLNEDILYYELQKDKDLSRNLLNFIVAKK